MFIMAIPAVIDTEQKERPANIVATFLAKYDINAPTTSDEQLRYSTGKRPM